MKTLKTTLLVIGILLLTSQKSTAQDNITAPKYSQSNKGKFFVSWGGNRDTYSKSDITFTGDNYNFTLRDVKAEDKPKGWHIDYINPTRLTIPQTNLKIGYFINDKYYVAVGVDHMKYVMTQNQFVNVDGYISLNPSDPGAYHNGLYQNQPKQATWDFLMFEHTNGLNYVFAEFGRRDDISHLLKITNTDVFQINITGGAGAGVLYPKTNTTLLLKPRYDEFHVSGYGISATAGLNLTFFKHFFIQGDLKGGFINMSDIRTTNNSADRASQHFWFGQSIISFGSIFRI
ncbi:hypothetical protein [Corallibacter sp.]|uniref:hypothetical protein n=1 Tax=Corallibacter sp. TaxID=2038084 RepID=UPI003AB28F99